MTKNKQQRKNFDRPTILERDGHKCKNCGSTKDLQVHHVDRDSSNNDPDNALTLCKKCHIETHRQINQETYWDEVEKAVNKADEWNNKYGEVYARMRIIEVGFELYEGDELEQFLSQFGLTIENARIQISQMKDYIEDAS